MEEKKIEIKSKYTRVSEIIGWFKGNELAQINPEVLQKKAQIGTNVHAAIASYDSGIFIPLNDIEKGYFESYLVWRNECKLDVLCQEKRFYCDSLEITGAVDCICTDRDTEEHFIIDFKTSVKEDPIGWHLQGGFYHYLAQKNGFNLRPSFTFVKLDKRGDGAEMYNYHYTDRLYTSMMSCYWTYNIWHMKKKELKNHLY